MEFKDNNGNEIKCSVEEYKQLNNREELTKKLIEKTTVKEKKKMNVAPMRKRLIWIQKDAKKLRKKGYNQRHSLKIACRHWNERKII